MTSDALMHAVAVLGLVQRQDGNTIDIDDAITLLAGDQCLHSSVSLYLAGLCVNLAKEAGYDLASLIEAERRDALAVDGPTGGLA